MTMDRQTHPLGLYLHIPFCRSKCAYCDFYSLSGQEDRMDAYTAALERHLIEVAPQAAQHLVDTVYFWRRHPQLSGGEAAGETAESREEALPHRPMQRSRWRPTPTAPGTGRPCGCGGRASTASPWGSSPRTTSVSGPWAASTHGSRCRRLWPPAGGPNSRT